MYITFVCEIGLGGRGGSQMKMGGSRKRGGQDPLTPPPSGHAYEVTLICACLSRLTSLYPKAIIIIKLRTEQLKIHI